MPHPWPWPRTLETCSTDTHTHSGPATCPYICCATSAHCPSSWTSMCSSICLYRCLRCSAGSRSGSPPHSTEDTWYRSISFGQFTHVWALRKPWSGQEFLQKAFSSLSGPLASSISLRRRSNLRNRFLAHTGCRRMTRNFGWIICPILNPLNAN